LLLYLKVRANKREGSMRLCPWQGERVLQVRELSLLPRWGCYDGRVRKRLRHAGGL